MNIRQPQTELPRDGIGRVLSGGFDLWDDGLAGAIISDEFFETPAFSGNQFWIRVGGSWKTATAWVRVAGVWKVSEGKVKVGGAWQ